MHKLLARFAPRWAPRQKRGVFTPVPHRTTREARPGHLVVYTVLVVVSCVTFGVDLTLGAIATALNAIFLVFFLRHFAFAVAAAKWADNDLEAPLIDPKGYEPTVAVFVGCKDEELVVDKMVEALLELEYNPDKLTLVVVDDGSTDRTGEILDDWAARDSRLKVLHRPPGAGGGKSGALNDALAMVDPEVCVVFDADHQPDPTAARRLVRHFRDPEVGAVMGRCVIRNGEESALASTIFVDYLSGYLVNEYGRQALFELPAYGGANCAVRASTLKALGGWNPDTVTEDTDLTLRVLASGQRVRFDPTAVDFEEAVVSAQRFWKQRYRWARGHQKCLRDYGRLLLTSPHLSVSERLETLMFLMVYHIPVLCGLGLALTLIRAFGYGSIPALDMLPISMLLFVGPLTELSVGLLLGRTERRSAWTLLGFLVNFALSIFISTQAYFDGMIGRAYSWTKTARSGHATKPSSGDPGSVQSKTEEAAEALGAGAPGA